MANEEEKERLEASKKALDTALENITEAAAENQKQHAKALLEIISKVAALESATQNIAERLGISPERFSVVFQKKVKFFEYRVLISLGDSQPTLAEAQDSIGTAIESELTNPGLFDDPDADSG